MRKKRESNVLISLPLLDGLLAVSQPSLLPALIMTGNHPFEVALVLLGERNISDVCGRV